MSHHHLPAFFSAFFAVFTLAAAGCDGRPDPATGGTGGTATSSGGAGGAAGGTEGLVPVFVAQGHMGRTTLSCDDGRSWVADRSLDDGARCSDPIDCESHPGAGRGLAYGAGRWVAAFGWGGPASVQTSADGVTWETAVDPAPVHAGVVFGQGVFIANALPPRLSADGETWSESVSQENLEVDSPSAIGFAPDGGGVFVITGESGNKRDLLYSDDAGKSWWHPDARPDECVGYVRTIAGGNGAIVASSGNGFVCTSTDGGRSWSRVDLGAWITAGPVFTGSELLVWHGGAVQRSADGLTWTSEPTSPKGLSVGPVARGPNGTFVAVSYGSQGWYEEQVFYRSTDGVTWEALDASSFKGGHPIQHIEPGWAPPSENCPLP